MEPQGRYRLADIEDPPPPAPAGRFRLDDIDEPAAPSALDLLVMRPETAHAQSFMNATRDIATRAAKTDSGGSSRAPSPNVLELLNKPRRSIGQETGTAP